MRSPLRPSWQRVRFLALPSSCCVGLWLVYLRVFSGLDFFSRVFLLSAHSLMALFVSDVLSFSMSALPHFFACVRSVGRFADWSVDRLVGWPLGRLAGRSVGRSVGRAAAT